PAGQRFGLDGVDAVVTEFTPEGVAVRRFGGRGVLTQPIRLAADERGILVLDERAHRLVELGLDGRIRSSWEYAALGLALPRGLTIDPRGRVLVADEALPALVAFERDLSPIGRLLDAGKEGGPLPFRPSDVATGADGGVYVYDASQGRVR